MHNNNMRNGTQNNPLRKFDYECKQRDSKNARHQKINKNSEFYDPLTAAIR